MSTPNLPRTENLTPLYELVLQLQLLVLESAGIKDSITGSIDTLSAQINGQSPQLKQEQLAYLKRRNAQLVDDLRQRALYVRVITALINNYELAIQAVLETVRADVVDYNLKLLAVNKAYFDKLEKKSEEEYRAYQTVVRGRLLMFEISEKLREVANHIDEEVLCKSGALKDGYELRTLIQVLGELTAKKVTFQKRELEKTRGKT